LGLYRCRAAALTLPAKCELVGPLVVSDDDVELTVVIGTLHHTHFSAWNCRGDSESVKMLEVAQNAAAFVADVLMDRVCFTIDYSDKRCIGSSHFYLDAENATVETLRESIFGLRGGNIRTERFLWTGPITEKRSCEILAMKNSVDPVALLKPLFDEYALAIKPASESSLEVFKTRAKERMVPQDVVKQLIEFYSLVDGVPCLDSLDVHRCDDLVIFESWNEQELWLGQRDFYTLRWSSTRNRFCIGDAGNVSFSASDEYSTFVEALRRLVHLYDTLVNV
jgi:hypothetical protein